MYHQTISKEPRAIRQTAIAWNNHFLTSCLYSPSSLRNVTAPELGRLVMHYENPWCIMSGCECSWCIFIHYNSTMELIVHVCFVKWNCCLTKCWRPSASKPISLLAVCRGPRTHFNIRGQASPEYINFNKQSEIGGGGRVQPRKCEIVSFRFVRAYVRAFWLHSGIRTQKRGPVLPFSLMPFWAAPFPMCFVQSVAPLHSPNLLSNFNWLSRYSIAETVPLRCKCVDVLVFICVANSCKLQYMFLGRNGSIKMWISYCVFEGMHQKIFYITIEFSAER